MSNLSRKALLTDLKKLESGDANKKLTIRTANENLVDSVYSTETVHLTSTTSGTLALNFDTVTIPGPCVLQDFTVVLTETFDKTTGALGLQVGTAAATAADASLGNNIIESSSCICSALHATSASAGSGSATNMGLHGSNFKHNLKHASGFGFKTGSGFLATETTLHALLTCSAGFPSGANAALVINYLDLRAGS